MATRVRPLQDRVIVKRVEEQEQRSAGGIIIPDTAKEKPQEGRVVAVGRLRRRVADDLATLQAGGSLAAGIEASPPRIEMSREPARPAE